MQFLTGKTLSLNFIQSENIFYTMSSRILNVIRKLTPPCCAWHPSLHCREGSSRHGRDGGESQHVRHFIVDPTVILYFIACTFIFPGPVHAQDSSFRLVRTIQYPVESFTVNNLGELYIINTNNQLKKLDDKGDSVGVFNMVTKYGRLSYVEA